MATNAHGQRSCNPAANASLCTVSCMKLMRQPHHVGYFEIELFSTRSGQKLLQRTWQPQEECSGALPPVCGEPAMAQNIGNRCRPWGALGRVSSGNAKRASEAIGRLMRSGMAHLGFTSHTALSLTSCGSLPSACTRYRLLRLLGKLTRQVCLRLRRPLHATCTGLRSGSLDAVPRACKSDRRYGCP